MSSESQNRADRVPLTQLLAGEKGRVYDLKGESTVCARLREMGFCETAIVEKVGGGYTVLCQVCGTRIALNSRAADHILVEKIEG